MALATPRISRCAVALAFSFASLFLVVAPAHAQTETVLYSFCSQPGCADGEYPYVYAKLVLGGKGNLYGTTYYGGANGYGTVFKLTPNGIETVLHSFAYDGTDGTYPTVGLIRDKRGNLYGTTASGGPNDYGTVFEVNPNGTETVPYSFCSQPSCADGAHPFDGLLLDKKGNFYGTTYDDGANGYGTVFELGPNGTEAVLYSFCSLEGCADGASPWADLVMDKNSNLYGTTSEGGKYGGGTVFELSPSGTEIVLYNFCSQSGCADGEDPTAGLVLDKKGNLYGTTYFGGANRRGTVFEISPNGTETVLHSFANDETDGAYPLAGLLRDKLGNLYGTTQSGGANGHFHAFGTVFKLSPNGTETVLYSFCSQPGCMDGSDPVAGLVMDKLGNLYGTTLDGGANDAGTVFKVTP
jgi:uncharacterized repeat protein (TIGR03803 family)